MLMLLLLFLPLFALCHELPFFIQNKMYGSRHFCVRSSQYVPLVQMTGACKIERNSSELLLMIPSSYVRAMHTTSDSKFELNINKNTQNPTDPIRNGRMTFFATL